MKWLKKLQFWKKKKKYYPTAEQIQQMVESYKQKINQVPQRDEKGRWIYDGEPVSTARFPTVLNQTWEEHKNNLLNQQSKCKCQGNGGCKCKKI